MSGQPLDPSMDGFVEVILPSGAHFPVHAQEVDHFNTVSGLYMGQHRFTDISDKQDLDRLLMLETLCYRWGSWLSREKDWDEGPIATEEAVKWFKDSSQELRQLKKLIGIDKSSRDKARGEDSPEAYIRKLGERAKAFGVTRNKQAVKSIELFHQLAALITLYDNCDERERREMHIELQDVVEWVREIAIPEFQALDAWFRENEQKYWIRDQ